MKKLFSLLFALSIFSASLPLSAIAATSGTGVAAGIELKGEMPTRYSLAPPISSDAKATDFLYGDQLGTNARAIYNQLDKITYNTTEIEFDLPNTLHYDTYGTPSYSEVQEMTDDVGILVQQALDAIQMDDALLFWLKFGYDGTRYEFYYEYDSNGTTIKTLKMYIKTSDLYGPNAGTYVRAVESAVNSFTVSNTTSRYAMLKEMHDFLARKITYTLTAPYAHEPYGALVTGEAVCEGYAEAMMLLCDKYSIPCIGVIGNGNNGSSTEPHKWNLVKMEDGKWYGLDVTWDDYDIGDSIGYDYFLIGTSTYDSSIGYTFSQSHSPKGDFSSTGAINFEYPTVNSTKYEYKVPDAKDIKVDYVTNSSIFLDIHEGEEYSIDGVNWTTLGYFRNLSKFTEYTVSARVASDGIFPAGDIKTAVFMIVGANEPILLKTVGNYIYGIRPNTLISDLGITYYTSFYNTDTAKNLDFFVKDGKVYNIIISGDVNGDGKINSTDFMQVRKAYLNTFELTGAKQLSADVNFDGKVNSTDFMQIRRHYLEFYDIFDY